MIIIIIIFTLSPIKMGSEEILRYPKNRCQVLPGNIRVKIL